MLLGVVFAIPRFAVLLSVGFLTGFLFFLATGVVVVFLRGLFASLIFRWCCPGNGATFFVVPGLDQVVFFFSAACFTSGTDLFELPESALLTLPLLELLSSLVDEAT